MIIKVWQKFKVKKDWIRWLADLLIMWKDEATDDELEEDIITQCENKAKGVWELIELPKCDIIRDDTIFAVRNGETTINLDWEQIAPVKEEKKIENKTLPLF